MEYFNSVRKFHEVFGHPVSEHPTLAPYGDADKDVKLTNLRIALIEEEFDELREGMENHDIIEIADAAADILYVAYGAAIVFGLNIEIKPARTGKSLGYRESANAFMPRIGAGLAALKEALDNANINEVELALIAIIRATLALSMECGIDIDAVFAEVQRSNMSKLDPLTGRPIFREDGKILKSTAYEPPNIERVLHEQQQIVEEAK